MLVVNHISKTFGAGTVNEKKALDCVNLEIRDGDFITVIGSNGAGKSTLLNAIAGTAPTDSGSISLNGKEISQLPSYKRAAAISRVYQNPIMGTSGEMTIEENLSIALKRGEIPLLHRGKKSADAMKESLRQLNLGLEERLTTKVSLLSGGQRQAISLLMATIKTPELILLDEHTSALDPKAAANILAVTDQVVSEQKISALMITHNLTDALTYGNRLIMMHEGRIIFEADAAEKKRLTKAELLQKFEMLGNGNALGDRMAFS